MIGSPLEVDPSLLPSTYNIKHYSESSLTPKTIDLMHRAVIQSKCDAEWRRLMEDIRRQGRESGEIGWKDYLGELNYFNKYFRDIYPLDYVRDPHQVELVKHPFLTLQSRGGDAFRKDTKVIVRRKLDNTYRIQELGSLNGKMGEYDALSFNYETGEFEFKPIVAWYDKGVKPMYRIETRNHRVLDVSTKHKMDAFRLQNSNFSSMKLERGVEAQELFVCFPPKSRPQLPFAMQIPELGTVNHLTSDQMFLEGMYLAEGWFDGKGKGEYSGRLCIGVKDEILFKKIEDCAKSLGMQYHVHTQSNGVKVLRTSDHAFRKSLLDKFGSGSFEKTIPEEYLSISRERMNELISAYAAGDAYKPKPESRWYKMANLIHNTSSSELARMLVALHLVMGRPLHPMLQLNHMGSGKKPIWRLIERKNTRCYQRKIGDVAGAAIARFEENGEAECCDVTVLDNHNVVTEGGVVVHNCDDLSTCWAASLGALGAPHRFRTYKADPTRPGEDTHVVSQIWVPNQGWVNNDLTIRGGVPGFEPTGFAFKDWPEPRW